MQRRIRLLAVGVTAVLGMSLFSAAMATEAMAATTADDVIKVAETQLGIGESPSGSDNQKYGLWNGDNGTAWCSEFASWSAHMAGARTAIGGRFSSARRHAEYFKSVGRFGSAPRVGAYIFFDKDRNREADHVGIVTSINGDGSVNTIEGNTSNMVRRRTRDGGDNIMGYGYPAYTTDPASTHYWVRMHAESADKASSVVAKAQSLGLAVRSAKSTDDGHITVVAHASGSKAATLRAYATSIGQPTQVDGTTSSAYTTIDSRLSYLVSTVYKR